MVLKLINSYVYKVEDLRNGTTKDVHAYRLKFYRDSSLDRKDIMLHVLNHETRMDVQCLMRLVYIDSGLMVHVHWCDLAES